jgi:mono/diheme cytochrome c family protein
MRRTLFPVCLFATLFFLGAIGCGKPENAQGKNLYLTNCANCHLEDGQGLRRLIPPLAGADYLADHPREVVRGIRYGMEGPMVVNGITYNHVMPGNKDLTPTQITNLVNYIHGAWGNDLPSVTVVQVKDWLEE